VIGLAVGSPPARAEIQVREVRVEGARALSKEDVTRLLGLGSGARPDTLRLGEAVARLTEAYAAEGYFAAHVTLDWTAPDSLSSARDFRVRIDEGAAWRVGEVRHEGALPEIEKLLSDALNLKSGDRYSERALEAGIDAILDVYDEAGHPYARVRPGTLDLAGGRVRLTLTHEPGPPVILDALELKGARSIRPKTAEQVMGFKAGRRYRQSELEDGIERLRASGLFTDVADAELVPGSDPAASRIRISVREAATGAVSGIVGYSGADRRLAGDLDFRLRNIAGTGRALRAHWSSRQRASTLYNFSYREPYLLGRPIDLSLDLEHVIFDTLYTRTRTDATLSWRIGNRFTLLSGVGQDHAVVTSIVRRSEGSFRARAGAQYDARNAHQAPSGGLFLSAEAERGKTLAGLYGDLAGSSLQNLVTVSTHGELYRRLSRNTVAALLVTTRTLETRAYPIPQYELFPLGGATSLRGYREEQFYTPGFLLAQLEYRLGVNRYGTGAYLFLDAASFSDATDRATLIFDGGVTKVGYGAGVRVGSRLGRVGVDYGLAAGEGPLDGRIHLRLEAEF
jgi:outer membrane protein insertion porin family